MKCFEIEKYKVSIEISNDEILDSDLTIEDIIDRTSKGKEYLKLVREYAVRTTKYEWPGCAFSMEMKVIPEEGLIVTFSETINDFLIGLKNSQKIADHGSILLRELINKIEDSDEKTARRIICTFEKNVKIANTTE